MLSRFFLGLFALMALLLNSCGTPGLEQALSRNYETLQGEFRALGSIRVDEQVTHLFADEDGKIFYAYSDRYDLDDYLDQTVEAYGVLSEYADLEQKVFDVKRLSAQTEIDEPAMENAVPETYIQSELGLRFTILNSWEQTRLNEPRGVRFTLPLAIAPSDDSNEEPENASSLEENEISQEDSIDVLELDFPLELSPDLSKEDTARAIAAALSQHHLAIAGQDYEVIALGPDQLLGLKYRFDTGDVYVFTPRGTSLFELSYHFLSQDESSRVLHQNSFSTLLNSFRFISSEEASILTPSDEPSASSDETTDHGTETSQILISNYALFSSRAYAFSMQYPAAWYYVGGSTGYFFNDKEFTEPVASGLLQLTLNTESTEGVSYLGDQAILTRKVDHRMYTLKGPLVYETVMKTMLDSIETIKTE